MIIVGATILARHNNFGEYNFSWSTPFLSLFYHMFNTKNTKVMSWT